MLTAEWNRRNMPAVTFLPALCHRSDGVRAESPRQLSARRPAIDAAPPKDVRPDPPFPGSA